MRLQIGRTTARGRPAAMKCRRQTAAGRRKGALVRAVPVQAKAAEPAMTHDMPDTLDDFPARYARTRRFTLGAPASVTLSPDGRRVLFLRSAAGDDPHTLLWLQQDGRERPLTADGPDRPALPPVTGYATDRQARLAAVAADGELWAVPISDERPRRLKVPGPVRDPRPSPDGSHIAYASGGALRLVRADGSGDRALAEPEGPDVAYGLPEYAATASIGRTRGYWWAPGGSALLVARVDSCEVALRHISDPVHPERAPRPQRYPAAGTANARVTLHVISIDGGKVPVRLPKVAAPVPDAAGPWRDGAFEYLVAADWTDAGPVATVQSRDQRTVQVLAVDPADGQTTVLHTATDPYWVQVPPGLPLVRRGLLVVPVVVNDVRTLRITAGDAEPVTAPDGLQVRAVQGADGGRVWFTASRDPWETHVWSYAPAEGFRRLTDLPGEHTATAAGGSVVLDSRTPEGRTVTLLREPSGPPRAEATAPAPAALPIAVTTHPYGITARPELLELGPDRLAARLHLPSWHQAGDDRLPVLLSPYGGPGMQVVTRAAGWPWAVCQWFAEQGFAVLAVDGRGTPGRGVAWQRTVWGDRIRPAVEDQVSALHYAAKHCPALDTARVAIRGWSYGGYLAAGAVLHRPDVFHAAVAGAAPADQTQYDTYWQERYLGHPEITPETYRRSSLIPYADRLRRPLLLVHGVEDDNVHLLHTLRLSAALLATGRQHSVLPLAGTGHANNRPGTADTLLWLELEFLRRSLGVRSGGDGTEHGTERGQLQPQRS